MAYADCTRARSSGESVWKIWFHAPITEEESDCHVPIIAAHDPNYPFLPWLWRVVRNLGIAKMRRRPLPRAHDWETPTSGPDPAEDMVLRETEEQVEAAIGTLTEPQQEVLRLTMAGGKAEEIAGCLGLSRCAVYQLLFKARRHVEHVLGKVAIPS